MPFSKFKGTFVLLGAVITAAVFSSGCESTVVEVSAPRYIQAVKVCSHAYDSIGDLSFMHAALSMSGYNADKGLPYTGSDSFQLDSSGRSNPCSFFLLGVASGNENTGIRNPRLVISTGDGRSTGPVNVNSDIYFDGVYNFYVLEIFADFNMDVQASASKALIMHFTKKRLKEIVSGQRSATLDNDAGVKNPGTRGKDPSQEKPKAEAQIAI